MYEFVTWTKLVGMWRWTIVRQGSLKFIISGRPAKCAHSSFSIYKAHSIGELFDTQLRWLNWLDTFARSSDVSFWFQQLLCCLHFFLSCVLLVEFFLFSFLLKLFFCGLICFLQFVFFTCSQYFFSF